MASHEQLKFKAIFRFNNIEKYNIEMGERGFV
jgi:hypothetical protein